MEVQPIVLINAVGLTPRLLPRAPHLAKLAQAGWSSPLDETVPAVTCTAQATMLTGKRPGTAWHRRQRLALSRDGRGPVLAAIAIRLLQAEPVYVTARRLAGERGRPFRCAKLFWWFNQGAAVDISVTPKPYYGADGNKVFGITGTPEGLRESARKRSGPVSLSIRSGDRLPGLPCTQWIARCAAVVLDASGPT